MVFSTDRALHSLQILSEVFKSSFLNGEDLSTVGSKHFDWADEISDEDKELAKTEGEIVLHSAFKH